jgi:hypothetical protein
MSYGRNLGDYGRVQLTAVKTVVTTNLQLWHSTAGVETFDRPSDGPADCVRDAVAAGSAGLSVGPAPELEA